MSHRTARYGLSFLFLFLIVIGVILVYLPVAKSFPIATNQEKLLCNDVLSSPATMVEPHKTYTTACYVDSRGWVETSIKASVAHAAYELIYSPAAPSSSTPAGPRVVEQQSGGQFSASFPVPANGTITLRVTNPSNSTMQLSGTFVSAIQIQVADSYQLTKYPYRYEGIAAAGLAGVLIFLLVWNPRRIATRTLDLLLGS